MTPIERRNKLAEALARGEDKETALLNAGYDPTTAAARMALSYFETPAGKKDIDKAAVSLRIGEVSKQLSTGERTSEHVLADLRDIYKMAVDAGNLNAAIKVLELEGKHRGTFAEKIEVSGKVDLVGIIAAARKRVAMEDVVDAEVTEK